KWNCACFRQQQVGLVCVHIIAARQAMYPTIANKWLVASDVAPRWLIPLNLSTNVTALQEDQDHEDVDESVDMISSTLSTMEIGMRSIPESVQPIMLHAVLTYFNNELASHTNMTRDPLINVCVGKAKPKGRPRGKANTLKAIKPLAVQVVEQAEKEDRRDVCKAQRAVKRRQV
ncbi:hypothetical protein J3B01_000508, partial [Coemansia erecta]